MTTAVFSDHSRESAVFFQLHLGGDRNFTYLLGDKKTGEAAVVDPGFAPEKIQEIALEKELSIQHILITHGHADHHGGAADLAGLTGAAVHAGAEDQVPGAEPLTDNQTIRVGRYSILAHKTPGHSPGHFCFFFEGRLATGDLLFCGKVGGTGDYFPGSSAEAEYESLVRILKLPDYTTVFPGHDYYGGPGTMPSSTIGHERLNNPFLTGDDFASFVHLKENWAQYKEEHGIR